MVAFTLEREGITSLYEVILVSLLQLPEIPTIVGNLSQKTIDDCIIQSSKLSEYAFSLSLKLGIVISTNAALQVFSNCIQENNVHIASKLLQEVKYSQETINAMIKLKGLGNSNSEFVQLLIKAGLDANSFIEGLNGDSGTLLEVFCYKGDVETVKMILRHGGTITNDLSAWARQFSSENEVLNVLKGHY
ncbi:hypothetical protein HK096_010039 [Nowakowskiella sp. JEL0078]|nr:hypothetical protein HK096_010039 [Nowakowskiella sp. JEL0078]